MRVPLKIYAADVIRESGLQNDVRIYASPVIEGFRMDHLAVVNARRATMVLKGFEKAKRATTEIAGDLSSMNWEEPAGVVENLHYIF